MLFFIKTYGCQQNIADSEKIVNILEQYKFKSTKVINQANVIIINTCAIREKTELKFFSFLGELKILKKINKEIIICVLGCVIQQKHILKIIQKKYNYVDIIISNDSIYELPLFIKEYLSNNNPIINTKHTKQVVEVETILTNTTNNDITANIPIIYGCNNFCSYCIVPKVKGPEKSRKIINIKNQIEKLIANGYKEFTLLGQNVNAYGKDIGTTFSCLLREICKIDSFFYIRFLSSNPVDITDELLHVMAENKKIVKHLHLPLQSGNNDVLYAMNRKYTSEKYIEIIQKAKKLMPDLTLSSDIIIGFPNETYDQFKDTLNLVKFIKFEKIFTFIFSKRYGTKAYYMTDNIDINIKKDWLNELLEYQNNYIKRKNLNMINKNIIVLIISIKFSNNQKWFIGKTQSNMLVYIYNDNNIKIGDFVSIKILKSSLLYFVGTYLKKINIS